MASLSDHTIVLDRAQLTPFRAHHETRLKKPGPEQQQQTLALKAFLDAMEPGHPAVPALTEAVRQGTEEKVEFVAPLEVTAADLHHLGDQRFVEVPYACSCGEPLTKAPDELAGVWAIHAGKLAKLPAEFLQAHVIVRLYGVERATATCACGQEFAASDKDPTDPGGAVAAWEQHVRSLA